MPTFPAPVPTNLYTNRAMVEAVVGVCGVNLRINDSQTTVVSALEETYLDYAIYVGSSEIDLYLSNRYAPAVLLTQFCVWNWATIIAAYYLTMRRCGSAPAQMQWMFEQTTQRLREYQLGLQELAGVPSLASPGISMSNVRMDPRVPFNQMGVEPSISDSTPTAYPQIRNLLATIWSQYGYGPLTGQFPY